MTPLWKRYLTVAIFLLAVMALATANAADLKPTPTDPAISWTEYVRSLWPVIVVVAGLLVAGLLLGLATRFTTIGSFEALKHRVRDLEGTDKDHDLRLQLVEKSCAETPTRQELQEDIAELGERMKGVEVGITGVKEQLSTTNLYLHTLIEQGVRR